MNIRLVGGPLDGKRAVWPNNEPDRLFFSAKDFDGVLGVQGDLTQVDRKDFDSRYEYVIATTQTGTSRVDFTFKGTWTIRDEL